MSEMVEGGASLAWRLLATLEGGSLILATSALLIYTIRKKLTRNKEFHKRNIHTVAITNTNSQLGKELKRLLTARECVVTDVNTHEGTDKVDALVIVGAEQKSNDLDGIATLVSSDVYDNLKSLESLSDMVKPGGCIAWACAGATSGPFSGATSVFDNLLETTLQTIANKSNCEPIWVGRCDSVVYAAKRVVQELLPCTTRHDDTRCANPTRIGINFGRALEALPLFCFFTHVVVIRIEIENIHLKEAGRRCTHTDSVRFYWKKGKYGSICAGRGGLLAEECCQKNE